MQEESVLHQLIKIETNLIYLPLFSSDGHRYDVRHTQSNTLHCPMVSMVDREIFWTISLHFVCT